MRGRKSDWLFGNILSCGNSVLTGLMAPGGIVGGHKKDFFRGRSGLPVFWRKGGRTKKTLKEAGEADSPLLALSLAV